MVMGSKEQQYVRQVTYRQRPDWAFLFLCLVPLNRNPHANLTFVASAYPEIIGVPEFKSRSRHLFHAHFGPFFKTF